LAQDWAGFSAAQGGIEGAFLRELVRLRALGEGEARSKAAGALHRLGFGDGV
jgi:hypothetical protein